MITAYSESMFITEFGKEFYMELVQKIWKEIQLLPEFLNNDPYLHSFTVHQVKRESDGKMFSLTVEANAHKKQIVSSLLFQYDFGIVKIGVSDEEMPDETLDRYNELKTLKEKSNGKEKN